MNTYRIMISKVVNAESASDIDWSDLDGGSFDVEQIEYDPELDVEAAEQLLQKQLEFAEAE